MPTMDPRDNHGLMSRFRASGVRISRAGAGSAADGQRLEKRLLAAAKDNPALPRLVTERGITERAAREYSIIDRCRRLNEQDDLDHALALLGPDPVSVKALLDCLGFIFGSAKQRQQEVLSSQACEITN